MDLYLRVDDGRVFPITAPARVGRDATCEVALSDARASRVHALVWRDGDTLCLRDEGSSNGTFVNERQLPPGQVVRLNPGDQLRIGRTQFVVGVGTAGPIPGPAPAAPAPQVAGGVTLTEVPGPARRRSPLPLVALGGCLALVVLVVCGGGAALAVARPPLVQTALAQWAPGPQGTPAPATVPPGDIRLAILSTSLPPTPLPPQAFAANLTSLSDAVAALNRAELDFIHRARTQAGSASGAAGLNRPARQFQPITEDDFTLIEHGAITAALLADQQSQTLAAQGGGNDPAAEAMAETYATLVQQAAAVALQVDEMRQSWLAQELGLDEAAARMALVAGAIWNAAVTEPGATGNPFAAYAADPSAVPNPQPLTPEDFAALMADLNNPAATLGGLAIAPATGEQTLTVPAAQGVVINLADPAVTQRLVAANSAATPNELAQAAGALLGASTAGDPNAPRTVTVPKTGVVVAGPSAAGAQPTLPTFPGGQAVTIITPEDDPVDLLGASVTLDGHNTPAVAGQIAIAEAPPVVTLTISNLKVEQINQRAKDAFNTFEADVAYSFDVYWTTTLTAPQVELDCVGGNHFVISTVSGDQHVSAKGLLILYPGAETAFCYASRNGNTLGSASVHFLVGDAAGATQRAIQVETDSVALNLTLTADALSTAGGEQTRAAQTQAVAQTADALSTEQAASQTAEAAATATYLSANASRFATETQQALTGDDDSDGVTNANDRCFDQAETKNNWRDEDGCPDTLPTMNISAAAFIETLTNGPVDAFSSLANLTVNFATGLTSGTLTGSAQWDGSYYCYNTSDPSEVFETVGAAYNASYSAEVSGTADGAARTYTGALTATGVTHITLTQQFTNDACTHLNSENLDDHWTGDGTVSGTWDGNTFGTLATDWQVDSVGVAGTWSGTVTLTE